MFGPLPSPGRVEIALIALGATILLARLLPWLIGAIPARLHGNIRTLLRVLVAGLTWLAGLSIVLSVLGVPVLAAFGVTVVGAALGAATLQLGQGLVGGAWLLIEGDFDIGDKLDINQYNGATLIDIRLRSLVLEWTDTATGTTKRITVPNQLLMGSVFARTISVTSPPEDATALWDHWWLKIGSHLMR